MARTLRAKLLGLFGIGQRKPATVIPRAGRRGQRLDFDIGGGDTTSNIRYAIANRLPVSYSAGSKTPA